MVAKITWDRHGGCRADVDDWIGGRRSSLHENGRSLFTRIPPPAIAKLYGVTFSPGNGPWVCFLPKFSAWPTRPSTPPRTAALTSALNSGRQMAADVSDG
jgi:hypothetical protein